MAQDGSPRRTSLVFPIVLIGIGMLFLFQRWNPAFNPKSILLTYWPLILIFIGIGKIWDDVQRSRNPNAPPGISLGATFGAVDFRTGRAGCLVRNTQQKLSSHSEPSRRARNWR